MAGTDADRADLVSELTKSLTADLEPDESIKVVFQASVFPNAFVEQFAYRANATRRMVVGVLVLLCLPIRNAIVAATDRRVFFVVWPSFQKPSADNLTTEWTAATVGIEVVWFKDRRGSGTLSRRIASSKWSAIRLRLQDREKLVRLWISPPWKEEAAALVDVLRKRK